MSAKTMSTNLTQGPVFPVLLKFALPIMMANLLQTAYNIVDMAIVGQFVGSVGLSAVSVGSDIMHLITLSINGLCNGAQILMAQLTSSGDKKSINRGVGTMFSFFMILGVILSIITIVLSRGILGMLNTPEEAMKDALGYTITCYSGIIFVSGYGLFGGVLRGMGDSKHPLLFVAVSSVVNVVLDLLFVAVMDMGAFGAALATVIAQGVSFVWVLRYLYVRREQFGFDFKLQSFKIDVKMLKRFLSMGIPMFLQSTLIQCGNMYVNTFIYSYGVVATAVNGIGTKLSTIAHVVSNGLIRAGSVMTAQSLGAGKNERVIKVYFLNTVTGLSMAALISLAVISAPEAIFGFFSSDPAVMGYIGVYLPAIVIRLFAFGSRSSGMAMINGLGKPKLNYAVGIIDSVCLRVGLSLLFGIVLDWGLVGFWYGSALGGFSPIIISGIYLLTGKWKAETKAPLQTEK